MESFVDLHRAARPMSNACRRMDYIFQGRAMVAIKRGNRWALVPEDCSSRVEILAKRHLLGR